MKQHQYALRNFECSTRFRVSSWIDDVGICAHALHVWLIAVVFQYWLTTLHSLRHDCTLLRCKDINPWNVLLVKETSLCFWCSCFSVSVVVVVVVAAAAAAALVLFDVWNLSCLAVVLFTCFLCQKKSPRRVEFGPLAWVTSAWQWNYKERNFKGLRLGQLGATRSWQHLTASLANDFGAPRVGRWLLGAPKPPRSS